MEKQIRTYLRRYKQDIAPAILFIAGIILLTRVIIPQVNEAGNIGSEVSTQEETNENLRESENILNSLNEVDLDSDYELVMSVLPANKSIGQIFQALTTSATRANVEIGSLNVQVGSVYDQEEEITGTKNVDGIPFLNIVLRTSGSGTADFTNFSNILYETSPILEINSIAANDGEGRYDLNFYFKPISKTGFEAQTVITPLTPQQQDLLTTLQNWDQ